MDFGCRRMYTRFLPPFFLLVILTLIITNCAEVGPPPGGPEDKSPPFVIGSSPANGATGVAVDDKAVLFFSESIVQPTGKKAVFISPRFLEEPELKWKSDRLIVIFPDSFEIGQTYIISLSTDITDRRNNRLDSLTSIAFSTGETIDSGNISGQVFTDDKPAAGVLVALYDMAEQGTEGPFDSLYGQYIAQTSSGGRFAFSYLPDKEFRLIAFEDRNRDERFSPGRESFAVPDRAIVVNSELRLDDLRMVMTSQDTSAASISAASYSSDGMLRLRFSSPISPSPAVGEPSVVKVFPVGDTTVEFPGQVVAEPEGPMVSILVAYVGPLAEGVYRVELNYDSTALPLVFDSLKVRSTEDKKAPEMVFEPGVHPEFIDDLKIQASFSEPLDTSIMTGETFQLFDDAEAQLALTYQWRDRLQLDFQSPDLRAGGKYRMTVTEFQIVDLAGNVMGDSLKEFRFSTIDPDSVGAILGDVEIALPGKTGHPVLLKFARVNSKQTFTLPVTPPEFKIELPAGKYLASGFIDSNGDGEIDRGSSVPYLLSETVTYHPDTITVRARFETAGISIVFR